MNLYRVTADADRSASEIEDDDVSLVASVRAALTIPLAVKLSPYYTSGGWRDHEGGEPVTW